MGNYVAHNLSIIKKTVIVAVCSMFLFSSVPALGQFGEQNYVGTIDENYKYAWSDKVGWITFSTDYSFVIITDERMTGYIWSNTHGWINLSPQEGGVGNTPQGNLRGHAWGEKLGWIDFSDAYIDKDGYFWGYLRGDNIGTVSLNCGNTNSCHLADFKVKTTWESIENRGLAVANAPDKYAWGPEETREDFRSNYETGTNRITFDDEYKKSLEHAIQIDMGENNNIEQFITNNGETYAQYRPGRLPMTAFDNAIGKQVIYRRDTSNRNRSGEFLTSADKDRDSDKTIYDQLRDKIYYPDEEDVERPYPTRGVGVREFLRENTDIESAIRAKERREEKQKEREKLLDALKKELLGSERYNQIQKQINELDEEIKKESEALEGAAPNRVSFSDMYDFLKASLLNFFQ